MEVAEGDDDEHPLSAPVRHTNSCCFFTRWRWTTSACVRNRRPRSTPSMPRPPGPARVAHDGTALPGDPGGSRDGLNATPRLGPQPSPTRAVGSRTLSSTLALADHRATSRPLPRRKTKVGQLDSGTSLRRRLDLQVPTWIGRYISASSVAGRLAWPQPAGARTPFEGRTGEPSTRARCLWRAVLAPGPASLADRTADSRAAPGLTRDDGSSLHARHAVLGSVRRRA